MTTYKFTAFAPKRTVQAALLVHDALDEWDFDLVIAGREVAEDRPQEWVLEGWYPRKPGKTEVAAIAGLFTGEIPKITAEKLPDENWLTLSQQGTQPISAGPFHVHTPDFPARPDAIDFVIPAAQAFGTGQHQTTAGCLEMLGLMKHQGITPRRIADIGTGTGLLGFAALRLWPGAQSTASDIDAVCAEVVKDNARANGFAMGARPGEMTMVVADGMDDQLLKLRGPYDLLMANILAGPLVELAPDFAKSVTPRADVLFAGLLAGEQEGAVRSAYTKAGFMLRHRIQRGDWSILWLRRRITGRDRARLRWHVG